jgi:signal transduction histidine kinase
MPTIKQNQVQKTYLLICLVSFLPFAVVGFLRDLHLFEFIELKTLDRRLSLPAFRSPQRPPQIPLIKIDAKSEELIQFLPWQPHIYASLLDALQIANPTAIGLVALFDREWEDGQSLPGDKLFAIRPYHVSDAANRRALPKVTYWKSLPHSLTQAAGVSFSEFPLSPSDGIYRSAQLVVKDLRANDYRYSLEMLILCQTYSIPPTSIELGEGFWSGKYLELGLPSDSLLRIPLDPQGRLFMRFVGDGAAFQSTSFVDALHESEADVAEFRRKFEGKPVLIGITTGDIPRASTPLGKMSALALRANLLNTLLSRNFIWQLSRKGNLLYLAFLAIVSTVATILIYRSGHGYRSMLLFGGSLILCHLLFILGTFVFFDLWIEVTGSSLGLILGTVVSSFLLAHLRLRYLLWQLQTTQDGLVRAEKEAVFGVMSARVRHELRNVLNLIRAPAEMIRNNFQKGDALNLGEHPEEIVGEMDAIMGWVTKLDEMIENELSFFQETHMNLKQQEIDAILRSAVEMMQSVVAENQIQVRLDIPPKIPLLRLDTDKMRIVFANLIKNACQAMSPGGELEIAIEMQDLASSVNRITVIVRDTGAGMPTEELDRIFEPFYTTKPRGLGLGLVNVKNIVEGHGGKIRVESQVGLGTTFFINLPYHSEQENWGENRQAGE